MCIRDSLGFTPHIDVFKIKAGQTTRIEVELTPISGVLGITSSSVKDGPAVRVFIDDKFFGKAPLETEMPLGNHQVRVERPGYYSESFAVKAEPGKRIDKDVELKPLPADQNPYLVKQPQVKWYQKWWVWTIAAVGAVSYTHLDVYKRQRIVRFLRKKTGIETAHTHDRLHVRGALIPCLA